MIYAIGIVAALLLGAGYVLQQRVAVTAPLADILHWRLLLDLMRRRVWWLGVGAMVIGQLLAAVALRFASVDVVEPLLSSNLLFALALAALLSRQRPRPAEIGGAALLSAALGVFLAVAQPRSSAHVVGVERMGLLAVACVAAVVLGTVLIGLECACVVALIAGVALIGRSRSLAIARSRAVAGTASSAGG
jgi:drug/metabolite transporter (DMT)-like permease